MRKNVIAGNWKMNHTSEETRAFINKTRDKLKESDKVEAIICAPYPYLPLLTQEMKDSNVKIAAQNMHEEDNGAYTGEVSPVMLKDIGVTHVILGHSERREYFNETDERVNKKAKAAHHHGLTPIICVGESLDEREDNRTIDVVRNQVRKALDGLSEENIANTILAYEPIWAIGTGKTASSEDANAVCKEIRECIGELTSEETKEKVVIQYGGSVNLDTIGELLNQSDIDGALVGGASLEAESFLGLVEAGAK
jgi:triosephosphate isomerase